jgi:hypothetical protein
MGRPRELQAEEKFFLSYVVLLRGYSQKDYNPLQRSSTFSMYSLFESLWSHYLSVAPH